MLINVVAKKEKDRADEATREKRAALFGTEMATRTRLTVVSEPVPGRGRSC